VRVALIVLLVLAAGLLPYLTIRKMLARLSGWEGLASCYGALREPNEWTWNHRTMRVGKVSFRRSMKIAVEADGLYLAEAGIGRQASLCIPWDALVEPIAGRLYGRPSVAFTLSQGRVEFPLDLYEAIRVQREGKRGRTGLFT
jgi:hypothetical protein